MTNQVTEFSPESVYFREAAKQGVFVLKYCSDCAKPHYYPRAICPHCYSQNLEWKESAGTGEVYSYTTVKRADPPYVVGYIKLDEGVTMLSNIVQVDPEKVTIGMRVACVFEERDGESVPCFAPAEN